ncbi:LPS export ABC transporter permease LptG [Loktanella sp. SALINAS62]|uniref:LPS export ABC transporter permease LptG n=1 Tax=Loktanella sp. SALINAS62 TaxID=2706124 RepID=UPI001B8CF0C2|nr:LPS export ABC transporter permease LptG [Loktanella sp. SALINAS62]MBS1304142.1 LPS export ABC transporter permease LptG [Loktanella sp. SALINAS62]
MILDRYFAWRFVKVFLAVLGIFALLVVFIGMADTLRRFADDAVGFGGIVRLSLLNAPASLYQIMPLIVIIAAISLFLGLARTSELVVARAAGRSGMRILVAPLIVAVMIGGVGITVLNPIVAATARQYEAQVANIEGTGSVLALSDTGLWLRQGGDPGQTVIHAARADLSGTSLSQVTFLTFGVDGLPLARVVADTANLSDGLWQLRSVKTWPLDGNGNPEALATTADTAAIPSTLTADEIRNSFGTPSSIPIWDLPAFIDRLQEAGFTAQRHKVWFQMELSQPAFLAAMVLIGAAFTMRPQRAGKTGLNIMFAVLVAFGIYFIRNFAQILGDNGDIPAALAAWVPPIAASGLALGLLLQREDG